MAENTKQFFQITEAARACGLSRSTLMRMEERGLLTPVFTAPDSGRRYYDNHNVARIMQIEKFKAMGLGSKEIADYFAQGGEAEVLLEALRRCGATFEGEDAPRCSAGITKADLLDKGLIGPGSAERRATLQRELGLPARLTANGLLEALDLLLTREEFDAL